VDRTGWCPGREGEKICVFGAGHSDECWFMTEEEITANETRWTERFGPGPYYPFARWSDQKESLDVEY
jgi:hypothetical protein